MIDTKKWFTLLGTNIRSRRETMGMSQEEVADLASIDVRYLGGIERAQRNPSLKVIIAIAQALETSPINLISDAHNPN
jgi:transcriptional regulator with XRE-family HTH domain